jgi:hypothetical protein
MDDDDNIWEQHKIRKINSSADLQTFIDYQPEALIDGELLHLSALQDLDFNAKTIFVYGLKYETQCTASSCGKMTRDKIKLNNSRQEITFDLKLRASVGGSGMGLIRRYLFFVIPNDEADYTISGNVLVDERAGLGGGAHDFTVEYQQ